jgi:arginase
MPAGTGVDMIGVPVDLGVRELGLTMGPDALRELNLEAVARRLGLDFRDLGNIQPPVLNGYTGPRPPGDADGGRRTAAALQHGRPRHAQAVWEYCVQVAEATARSVQTGRVPVCVGGDHSLAIGSIAGAASQVAPLGCFWIDAHPDANTPETSPSGNIHGMSVAVVLGHGPQELVDVGAPGASVAPEHMFLLGTRDIDPGEDRFLSRHGVGMVTVFDILERGLPAAVRQGLRAVGDGTRGVHVSLDLDVLHEAVAPGVGIPSECGLTMREATYLCRRLAAECRIVSVDVIGLNPVRDRRMETARRAAELLLSLLGRTFSFTYEDYLRQQHAE